MLKHLMKQTLKVKMKVNFVVELKSGEYPLPNRR